MWHVSFRSSHNIQINNNEEDFSCERVFAPWLDMEEEMRLKTSTFNFGKCKKHKNLISWFTGYEMSYTNILNILDLANIPYYQRIEKMRTLCYSRWSLHNQSL